MTDHDVCVVDSFRYGQCRFNDTERSRIRFENLDIRELRPLQNLVDSFQPESIVHLAAIHFIPECEGNPELAVSTNVLGTSNVASVCPPACRFVFASTGAVYQPELTPHQEHESTLGPADLYGWTKLHGEHYVRYFARQKGFAAGIIRLFNVIGPGETNPHVLPEIVAQLKAGRTILQLGNLDAKRDYIHVSDVVAGFAKVAIEGTIPRGETCVVNLGTQNSVSVAELLDQLRDVSSLEFKIEADPARMRPSDRPYLAANISRIRQQFGWQPQWTIRESLVDLWANADIPQPWIDQYR
jgi:UDP-glucose 4-epimerase